ncbi:hypothetical protein [Pseudoalteromonas phage KB12-38]|nr:hypothetical protein [Pseudoalteromonas phage KB12-38]
MSRNLRLKTLRKSDLNVGVQLVHKKLALNNCVIVSTAPPPELTMVKYKSGVVRGWSLSHLKKYYAVRSH